MVKADVNLGFHSNLAFSPKFHHKSKIPPRDFLKNIYFVDGCLWNLAMQYMSQTTCTARFLNKGSAFYAIS